MGGGRGNGWETKLGGEGRGELGWGGGTGNVGKTKGEVGWVGETLVGVGGGESGGGG